MSAYACGVCMSQCKHWRIPSYFGVPRKAKYACESSRGCHVRRSLLLPFKTGPASPGSDFVFWETDFFLFCRLVHAVFYYTILLPLCLHARTDFISRSHLKQTPHRRAPVRGLYSFFSSIPLIIINVETLCCVSPSYHHYLRNLASRSLIFAKKPLTESTTFLTVCAKPMTLVLASDTFRSVPWISSTRCLS